MSTVVVLGSTITDLVARAPRLPIPGEAVIGDDFATFLGGKGFNQAVAAARLGASVRLVGRVGTDTFGDAFASALVNEGIDNSQLTRDPATGTGTACVMIGTDTGQNAIIVLPRANLALTAEMVEEAIQSILLQSTALVNTRIFMAQCEMRMATIAAGLRSAHSAGMITIFNAAPVPREPIPDDLFTCVDILVVNESEAAGLAETPVDTPHGARRAATRLLTKGVKNTIITLGAQGCVWSTNGNSEGQISHRWIRTIPVTQVDATAAGDAFCGALAAKLAEGSMMSEALRWASAAGAVAVTRLGALPSLPTTEEVEALLREANKE
ncbi:MAG TPA: ribokinase [Ktedonobacteraceae bacterium]